MTQQQGGGEAQARPRPMRPVYVVGEDAAALGAATALVAFQVLTGRIGIPNDARGMTPLPPQPVALFSAATDVSWEDKLKQRIVATPSSSNGVNVNVNPILHVPIEVAGILLRSVLPEIQNGGISFVGVQMGGQESQGIIPPDMAQSSASTLKQLSDSFPTSGVTSIQDQKPFAFVSLGLSLHLAMLQANCLPKSHANRDCYHVLMPEGGSIHVDYLYDTSSYTSLDPLSCPTKEMVISTPPTFATTKRSATSAAAYSALRGNGMDLPSSAAIAAAVATILGDDSGAASSISWSTIERVVQLSRHIREFGTVERPGVLRIKYKEYGYK